MRTTYKLLETDSSHNLNTLMEKYLSEGWEPFGSPSVVTKDVTNDPFDYGAVFCRHDLIYLQAIIKRDE